MAVIGANLTAGSTGSGSTINTASISYAANTLVLVSVGSRVGSGPPNQPTITGASMTWTQVATKVTADNNARLTVFRGLSASSGSGVLTIDFGGQSQDAVTSWSVDQLSAVDTSGANGAGAIIQTANNAENGAGSTTIVATLGAFANLANATFGVIYEDTTASFVVGSGFTQLGSSSAGGAIMSEYKATNDTTVDFTYNSNVERKVIIGIEIKAGVITSDDVAYFM